MNNKINMQEDLIKSLKTEFLNTQAKKRKIRENINLLKEKRKKAKWFQKYFKRSGFILPPIFGIFYMFLNHNIGLSSFLIGTSIISFYQLVLYGVIIHLNGTPNSLKELIVSSNKELDFLSRKQNFYSKTIKSEYELLNHIVNSETQEKTIAAENDQNLIRFRKKLECQKAYLKLMNDCHFYEQRVLKYFQKGILLEKLYNEYDKEEANKINDYLENDYAMNRNLKKKKTI